jgi:hypothetical protein
MHQAEHQDAGQQRAHEQERGRDHTVVPGAMLTLREHVCRVTTENMLTLREHGTRQSPCQNCAH